MHAEAADTYCSICFPWRTWYILLSQQAVDLGWPWSDHLPFHFHLINHQGLWIHLSVLLFSLHQLNQRSPTFLAQGPVLWKTVFPRTRVRVGGGGVVGFRMIQTHSNYCVLYFNYYYISSTSDHQALNPGGWEPLV